MTYILLLFILLLGCSLILAFNNNNQNVQTNYEKRKPDLCALTFSRYLI